MSLVPNSFTLQKFEPYEWNNELKQIKFVVNGAIQFGALNGDDRNIDGEMNRLTFTTANTDVTINHGLKTIPIGYLTLRSSNGGVIYDGSLGDNAFTKTAITLRSTTSNNTVILFILR